MFLRCYYCVEEIITCVKWVDGYWRLRFSKHSFDGSKKDVMQMQ